MPVQDPVLYAVCDGEKARFMRYDGHQMRTIHRLDAHHHPDDDGLLTTSIKEPKSDPKELTKERFARTIAAEIEKVLAQNAALKGLVLAASPHVLHDLRVMLSKATMRKIVKTESKDLTNIPDHEMFSHFNRPATGWPQLPR